MLRHLLTLTLAAGLVAVASAHFPFLVPVGPNQGKAVFSDSLRPDHNGVPVSRIAGTKLMLLADGKAADLAWAHDERVNCYAFDVPGSGTRVVVGTTDFGVLQRGEGKPFLMRYFPKAVFGDMPTGPAASAGDRVPLELIPMVEGGSIRFKAVAGGKPMVKAEVTVLAPGDEKGKVFPTDDAGLTPTFDKPGTYGAQVRLVEEKSGEAGGKKYAEVRHYATLAVTFAGK